MAVAVMLVAGSANIGMAADEAGYEIGASYTADILSNVSGGIDSGTQYLDNLDVTLEIDVSKAWGFGGGRVFLYGLYNNGETFSDELVGDAQVVSNIEAPEAIRLYEAWYEYDGGPWSVRAGLYDLNSEFDVNRTGSLFLNSSHGIGADFGQSGLNGPSIFPVTSMALRGEWQADDLTARFAVLDGVPGDPDDPGSNAIDLSRRDGMLLTGELDVPVSASMRLWTGYWRYTGSFEHPFGPGEASGNDGWYLGVEKELDVRGKSASVFARYGRADPEFNVFDDYLGVGIVLDAPFPGRPRDALGLAVASAGAGTPYRHSLIAAGDVPEARETIWEVTYRLVVNENLELQPDVQFVSNPSSTSSVEDALAVGLRIVLSY